jgi:hypothetical protein
VHADALESEPAAKRRLAGEYDAAQARGEVARDGRPKTVPDQNGFPLPGLEPTKGSQVDLQTVGRSAIPPATTAELGLTRKQVHDARQVRDAERAEPGLVRRTLDALPSKRPLVARLPMRATRRAARRPVAPLEELCYASQRWGFQKWQREASTVSSMQRIVDTMQPT